MTESFFHTVPTPLFATPPVVSAAAVAAVMDPHVGILDTLEAFGLMEKGSGTSLTPKTIEMLRECDSANIPYTPIADEAEVQKGQDLFWGNKLQNLVSTNLTTKAHIWVTLIARQRLRYGEQELQIRLEKVLHEVEAELLMHSHRPSQNCKLVPVKLFDGWTLPVSEKYLVGHVDDELRKRTGRGLPEDVQIYERSVIGEKDMATRIGTYFFLTGSIRFFSNSINQAYSLYHEGLHHVGEGFATTTINEGLTEHLVPISENFGDGDKEYLTQQRIVKKVISSSGSNPLKLSYFTGDERFIAHALGAYGAATYLLFHCLDDFDEIAACPCNGVNIVDLSGLILANRTSFENLLYIASMIKVEMKLLRYFKRQAEGTHKRYYHCTETYDPCNEISKTVTRRLRKTDRSRQKVDWSPLRHDLERHAESDIIPLREAARVLLASTVTP